MVDVGVENVAVSLVISAVVPSTAFWNRTEPEPPATAGTIKHAISARTKKHLIAGASVSSRRLFHLCVSFY
jgi:hypothetical protein